MLGLAISILGLRVALNSDKFNVLKILLFILFLNLIAMVNGVLLYKVKQYRHIRIKYSKISPNITLPEIDFKKYVETKIRGE